MNSGYIWEPLNQNLKVSLHLFALEILAKAGSLVSNRWSVCFPLAELQEVKKVNIDMSFNSLNFTVQQ